ncbi:hypothetical protein HYT01_02710 [Candidatus Giovannonibacteria bacterium]|nr:hypothetical protein [Candidatus Giovannonibacteria bacterium]
MKRKDPVLELNMTYTTLVVFLEAYNKSIPVGFPAASVKTLKAFQTIYPSLFKHGDSWSIERHRKKVMDWLCQ